MLFYQEANNADLIPSGTGSGKNKAELPYKSVKLSGAVAAFIGEFTYELGNLQDFCQLCGAEVAPDIEDEITVLVVGKNAPTGIVSTVSSKVTRLSEGELLNLTEIIPASLTTFIDTLIKQGFDITFRSNEGDGFKTMFQWQTKLIDVRAALLAYIRQSEVIQGIMVDASRPYSARQLEKVSADFTPLDEQDLNRGWYQFLDPAEFAWNIYAYLNDTIVSGISLLQTIQACVDEVMVLAVHDQALENSVDAVHLLAGFDSQGQLSGFVLHRVWT